MLDKYIDNNRLIGSGMSDNNVVYKGLIAFNNLPSNIRNNTSLYNFKLALRNYFDMKNFIEF